MQATFSKALNMSPMLSFMSNNTVSPKSISSSSAIWTRCKQKATTVNTSPVMKAHRPDPTDPVTQLKQAREETTEFDQTLNQLCLALQYEAICKNEGQMNTAAPLLYTVTYGAERRSNHVIVAFTLHSAEFQGMAYRSNTAAAVSIICDIGDSVFAELSFNHHDMIALIFHLIYSLLLLVP